MVATKISDIIDHDASIMTRLRFYSHLMMCTKCRQYYQQFKTLKEVAGETDPEQLPSDFEDVMNFVMNEIENDPVKKN